MSEYTPITVELRGMMFITESEQGTPMVELGWFRFKQLCDSIDAIHAGLERENAELKAKLDRVTMDQKGAKDYYYRMGYDDGYEAGTLTATYDMDNARLKDMDGVPINVGDVMEWSDGTTFEVVGIGDGTLFYVETDENGSSSIEWTSCVLKRHHNAPTTVESVLREFVQEWWTAPREEDGNELLAEYAKRLSLVGDSE